MVIIEPTVDNNAVWPVVRIILGVGLSRYSEPSSELAVVGNSWDFHGE